MKMKLCGAGRWGIEFGMKGEDYFRSGAGINELYVMGRLTLCDVSPRSEFKDPFFSSYRAVVDEAFGTVSVSGMKGSSEPDDFFLKLAETAGLLGRPGIMDTDERRGNIAVWRTDEGMVTLLERKGSVELCYSAEIFPSLWRGRDVSAEDE